jgi:hypothetical protein
MKRSSPLLVGLALYVLQVGFSLLVGAALPWLLELGEAAPRLAALAWLVVLMLPVSAVAVGHRALHLVLGTSKAAGTTPGGVASVWAGVLAGSTMMFASVTSAFLFLAIYPPPRDEGLLAALSVAVRDIHLETGVHALLWVGVASIVIWTERAARRSRPPA